MPSTAVGYDDVVPGLGHGTEVLGAGLQHGGVAGGDQGLDVRLVLADHQHVVG